MAKRMLIDAAHPEEIRVAILNGNRLEEFDFEAAIKRQIKGNIYLAKVTRVEPSLQAAFVEYGGNRHGFLAFNEIHPDYYRIPVSDRAAFKYEPRRPGDSDHEPGDDADRHGGNGHGSDHDHSDHDHAESAGAQPDHADDHAPEHDHDGDYDADHAHDQADEVETDSDPATEGAAQSLDHVIEESERSVAQAAQTGEHIIYDTQTPEAEEREVATDRAAPFAESETDRASSETMQADGPRSGEGGEMPSMLEITSPGDSHGPDGNNSDGVAHDELTPHTAERPETIGGGDEIEEAEAEAPRPRFRSHRHYKIQEVIKRRQIMLVQVTKEERGNKGAALTTYLSLAGRYCVLMPNTPRGGGVSRKITSAQDRRRLKDLMSDLSVPDGMGVIVRTAGSERTKPEIKRDFEYLMRLWDEIRDLTLKSTAPALVYEEGNLIKRSIRDLYSRDIEEVVVDGDDAYRNAKTFMKMLMPSHAKRVKPYRDPTVPLFHRFQAEGQIDAIHSPVVQLRSGGYIVINPTEALVAIDVNSGRATRERNIEETALRTNLEAAEEVARQLRLRDLAGLIVIDFIDMEESRNVFQVERRMKDGMRNDRARIQIGRISAFGLLELSRQRLRPSLLEASTEPCPHCGGTGHIRSTESTALHILRAIEEEGMRRRSAEISVAVPTVVALYLLNHKREALSQNERRYSFHIAIGRDDTLVPPAFRLDRLRALTAEEIAALPTPTVEPLPIEEDDDTVAEDEAEDTAQESTLPPAAGMPTFDQDEAEVDGDAPPAQARGGDERGDGGGGRGRGRRHRRRGGDGRDPPAQDRPHGERNFTPRQPHEETQPTQDQESAAPDDSVTPTPLAAETSVEGGANGGPQPDGDGDGDGERKRRRRGRRGGRRRRHENEGGLPENGNAPSLEAEGDEGPESKGGESFGEDGDMDVGGDIPASEPIPSPEPDPAPAETAHRADHGHRTPELVHEPAQEPAQEPERTHEPEPMAAEQPAPEPEAEPAGAGRRGWWRRR